MVVNGFELPVAFVELCEAIQRGEMPYEWDLKHDVDSYGQPWQVADLRIYCDPEEIEADTDWLLNAFSHENRFQHPLDEPLPGDLPDESGFIQNFSGVANFVWFARATDGMPYCFDFGADPKEPSVVYWDHGYWRRVAPNFTTFMALFVPPGEGPDRTQEDAPREAVRPTPRDMLAAWTLRWVVSPRGRPFFEDLASDYAACSEGERREVEVEVREKLERGGMTDEQRRMHEDLWERLRAGLPS